MLRLAYLVPVVVFLWEHFGRINDVDIRPTLLVGNVTAIARPYSIKVGEYIARVSSYLYHMHVKEMVYTICNIVSTIIEFLLLPVWMAKGYIETAYQVYGNPYVIYIGSALILGVVVALMVYYKDKIPLLKSINEKNITNFLGSWANYLFLFFTAIVVIVIAYYMMYVYPTLDI